MLATVCFVWCFWGFYYAFRLCATYTSLYSSWESCVRSPLNACTGLMLYWRRCCLNRLSLLFTLWLLCSFNFNAWYYQRFYRLLHTVTLDTLVFSLSLTLGILDAVLFSHFISSIRFFIRCMSPYNDCVMHTMALFVYASPHFCVILCDYIFHYIRERENEHFSLSHAILAFLL